MTLPRLRERVAELGWKFSRFGESTHADLRLIDSFDWRLCRSGEAFVVVDAADGLSAEGLAVNTRRKPENTGELPAARRFPPPVPADSEAIATLSSRFPDVEKRRAGRRLLVLGSITVKESRHRIVDKNAKTLAVVKGLTPSGRGERSYFCVFPLRGFSKALRPLIAALGQDSDSAKTFVDRLARSARRNLFDYGGKPTIPLTPEMTSAEAYTRVISYLFDVIRVNVVGMLDQTDDEFLHDFRVALRRLRTVVSSLEVDLPQGDADALRRLWDATGEARDLDVFLAQQYNLRNNASAPVERELLELFSRLEDLRSDAYARLGLLVSHTSLSNLEEALLFARPADAELPIGGRVEKLIRRRDKKFEKAVERLVALAAGGSGAGSSPRGTPVEPPQDTNTALDKLLHAARIRAKKARYVREVFSGLPAPTHGKRGGEVKRLRKLQDALGAYNDLVTEESHMHDLLTGRDRFGTVRAAIGYLLAHIEREKARARQAVISRLEQKPSTG